MDKLRIEPTIFFIEKISFSLKLFSGHFYGQSFIKTVRGPLLADIVHGNSLLCELETVENLPLALIANDKHLLISYSVTVSPRGM